MSDYSVELQLGDYSFTIAQGDAVDPDAVLVLDDLAMSWHYDSEDYPGAQLQPLVAGLSLACRDVTLLDQLARDDLASVRLLDGDGLCFGAVYGRISDLTADQQLRGDDVWTLYGVTVTDHTTRQEPITASFAAAIPKTRFTAIRAAASTPLRQPAVWDDAAFGGTLQAQDVSEAGLLDVVRAHFREVPTGQDFGNYPLFRAQLDNFYLLAPIADAVTGELALVSAVFIGDDVDPYYLPGTLGLVGNELHIVAFDAFDGVPGRRPPAAVPGAQVELSAGQWRQGVEGAAQGVTAKRSDDTAVTVYVAGANPSTATRRVVETTYAETWRMQDVAEMYLPDPVLRGWDRDGFVWHVDDPRNLGGPGMWFPVFDSDEHTTAEISYPERADYCFTGTFAVFDITDQGDLTGGTNTYGGQLKGVTLTIHRGHLVVSFGVRRQLPRVSGGDAVTPAWLRANFPTVKLRVGALVVDPGITVRDLRLVRS